MLKLKLPTPIIQKDYEADELSRQEANFSRNQILRGAPCKPVKFVPPTLFVCESEQDLAKALKQIQIIVGKSYRGNKRIGKKKLYCDLLAHFKHLESVGVRLPRGGNISREMIMHGLGQTLRDSDCTKLTDEMLMKNGAHRRALGKKMDRIFRRVVENINSSDLENYPAKIE